MKIEERKNTSPPISQVTDQAGTRRSPNHTRPPPSRSAQICPPPPPSPSTTAAPPPYDASNGGWHARLGADFATWIAPHPGESVLDLACGTGLVTLPMASAVGPSGLIVGVDISPGMLAQARRKPILEDAARAVWMEHDVTDLDDVRGELPKMAGGKGFDAVSCCSALVLLPDPQRVIEHWATLLKPGGRMIVDVPTEDQTLQYLFTVELQRAVGLGTPVNRTWVQGVESLEKVFERAGMVVEKSWRVRSYTPETVYGLGDRYGAFEKQIRNHRSFTDEEKVKEARRAWVDIWERNVLVNGMLRGGHPFYVSIGRKR